MKKHVFIAGHNGMVGSAIHKQLISSDAKITIRNREELNFLEQHNVEEFFKCHQFDEVYMCAAKVGGIHANSTYPADFIYENLTVQNNIIHSAHLNDIPKVLFLGSSCIYPKHSEQPIKEESLLKGKLEPTNEPYAIAKIAGIKTCEAYNLQYGRDYRSVMPTNLYGPNDNFHPDNSHVIPGMIRRFHEAITQGKKSVTIWGTGSPKREFLHVDDMASACIHIMELDKQKLSDITHQQCSHINIGYGEDVSIKELAELIADVTKFKGDLIFDDSKPDGTPRKLLDSSILQSSGWSPTIPLKDGLISTYQWYIEKSNFKSL